MRNPSVFLAAAGLLLAGSPGLATAAEAKPWAVDAKRSSIGFSGQHMGKAFKGSFGAWQASIDFDPAKPEAAKVAVTIDLASAKTGGNAYVADGQLTMRGKAVPVKLPFTLTIAGNTATMDGKVTLKRTAWGIGSGSDAKGDWVSLDIPVQVKVVATAKQG